MGMEVAELRECGRLKDIRGFIDSLYGHDLHAKRVGCEPKLCAQAATCVDAFGGLELAAADGLAASAAQ